MVACLYLSSQCSIIALEADVRATTATTATTTTSTAIMRDGCQLGVVPLREPYSLYPIVNKYKQLRTAKSSKAPPPSPFLLFTPWPSNTWAIPLLRLQNFFRKKRMKCGRGALGTQSHSLPSSYNKERRLPFCPGRLDCSRHVPQERRGRVPAPSL